MACNCIQQYGWISQTCRTRGGRHNSAYFFILCSKEMLSNMLLGIRIFFFLWRGMRVGSDWQRTQRGPLGCWWCYICNYECWLCRCGYFAKIINLNNCNLCTFLCMIQVTKRFKNRNIAYLISLCCGRKKDGHSMNGDNNSVSCISFAVFPILPHQGYRRVGRIFIEIPLIYRIIFSLKYSISFSIPCIIKCILICEEVLFISRLTI